MPWGELCLELDAPDGRSGTITIPFGTPSDSENSDTSSMAFPG